MANAQDKLLVMGDLFYSTDYDPSSTSITPLTATNQWAVKSELDALSYVTVWHIKEFGISHALENEEIIRAGNCGVGELARLAEKTPTISFTWLDVNNRSVFDKMLGLDKLNVAGVLVAGASQVTEANKYAFKQFIKIVNQNGNGSAITVNTVTWSVDGLLVTDIDYYVWVNEAGEYGIFVIDSATVTTMNQTFTINYDYTPNAYTLDGYNIQKDAIPYGLYKFVSCVNPINATQGIKNTVYFWKYSITGEMLEQFIDRVETEFAGAEISFVWGVGWGYLTMKETVTL